MLGPLAAVEQDAPALAADQGAGQVARLGRDGRADADLFEILVVFGRNMVWSVARGALRFLSFASSRAAKIYGDLAEIYGASPQFFATD